MKEYIGSKKQLLIIAVLATLLIYFLHYYMYNLPHSDDFFYARGVENTNPLLATFSDYFTWSGRVFSNFLYYLFIQGLNLTIYKIVTFSSLVLSFLFAFIVINYFLKTENLLTKITIWFLFVSTWLFGMKSPNDSLFWLGGVVNYPLPMVLIFIASFLIFLACKTDNKKTAIVYSIPAYIILFISAFSNESLLLSVIWCYFLALLYVTFKCKQKERIIVYIAFFLLIVSLGLAIFSPGSAVRMNAANDPSVGRFFWSVWKSLMTTFERSFENYFISMVIPSSLLIYFLLVKRKLPLLFPTLSVKMHSIIFFLIGFTSAWVAHFVIAYALGSTGLPPRGKIIPQTFNLIFFMLGTIYLFNHLNFGNKIKKYFKTFLICFIWLIGSAFFSSELTGSILSLGEHKLFYKTYSERLEYLKSGNGFPEMEIVIVTKLPVTPMPISNRHLSGDCNYYINQGMAQYYGINGCLRIEDGFDGDASHRTDILKQLKYFFSDGAKKYIQKFFSRNSE